MHSLHFALALMTTVIFTALPAKAQYQEPREVWSSVNEGWDAPYTDLEQQLKPNKNYVIWSIIAPKNPLDLRKPEFFKTAVRGASKESLSISHNLVAWRCELPSGEFAMGAAGMSGETTGQTKELVMNGWGLTAFLATFTDGWISGGFQTGGIFEARSREEDVYTLAVEVSGADCANMVGYLKKFVFHKNRPYQKFGLRVNPDKFEGAGCISFAEALMKRAGVFTEVFKGSHRILSASAYRFGGNDLPAPPSAYLPRLQWREERPKKVSLNEFFTDIWTASGPAVNMDLIDPELLVWGFKNLSSRSGVAQPRFTKVQPQSCGDDHRTAGCALKKVAIDNKFDKKTAAVAGTARAWKKKMQAKGYSFRDSLVIGQPVIIVERR